MTQWINIFFEIETNHNILFIFNKKIILQAFKEINKPIEILESDTNQGNWNLELERVLPLLKVSIKSSKFY